MTRMMCPHCGWSYDPSINGEGYSTVLNHWFKGVDCPGQGQHPRNALSDKRPLWNDDERSATIAAANSMARKHEMNAKYLAKKLKELAEYAATVRDQIQPEWMEGLVEHLNEAAIALDDPTQFVLRKKIDTFQHRYIGEMWITAEKIP